MKKAFNILLFSSFIFLLIPLIKVNGNSEIPDLVIIVNNPLSTADLEIDGYTIYANNVNYNEVGSYKIIYKNNNNETFERNVRVINKETAILKESNVASINKSRLYNIEKINVDVTEESYFLVSSYKLGYNDCFNISYYEGDILLWQRDYNNLSFKHTFLITSKPNVRICIIATDNQQNTYLFKFNRIGTEEKIKVSETNPQYVKYDKYNDYLYFIYNESILLLSFSSLTKLKTINLTDYIKLKYPLNMDINILDNGFEYLYVINNEVNYFRINNELLMMEIKKLDIELYDYFEANPTYDFILSTKIKSDTILVIRQINDYLSSPTITDKKIEVNEEIRKVNINYINELAYITITLTSNEVQYYCYYKDFITKINTNGDKLLVNSTTYGLISEDNALVSSHNNLEMFIIEEENTDYRLEKIYFFNNGVNIPLDQPATLSTFGYFTNKISKTIDNTSYIINYDYYVFDKCNIKNNDIIQTNTTLTFLGEGILNNEKIESGYKLKDNGNYTLQLIGNNETKYISFLVTNINEEYITDKGSSETIQASKVIINKQALEEADLVVINEDIIEYSPYVYIIMSVISSIIIYVLIKISYKRRRR